MAQGSRSKRKRHAKDTPEDETTITLTSRYDREIELRRLREIAARMSPREVRELFYDSKSGIIFARMRHELNGQPSPLTDFAVRQVWPIW